MVALLVAACTGARESGSGGERASEAAVAGTRPARAGAAAEGDSIAPLGLYADVAKGALADGAIEYTPDYPLWSDGAEKRRWVMLPADSQIDTSDMDHWKFPIGTKFAKEFSLDGVRLETRVIERVDDTGNPKKDLILITYVWTEDQSDAVLTKGGVNDQFDTPHDVPKQKDCIACHIGEPAGTLGFSALQLSESGLLTELEQRGLLSDPPGRTFTLPGTEVEKAAIGMLQGNCAHCHTEGTPGEVMRLRVLVEELDKPLNEWQLYRTTLSQPVEKWTPRPEAYGVRIVPGFPEESALWYRMTKRDSDESVGEQMPPLATEQVDEAAVAAVRAWIASMPAAHPVSDAGLDAGAASGEADGMTEVDSGPAGELDGTAPADTAQGDAGVVDMDAALPIDPISSQLDAFAANEAAVSDEASSPEAANVDAQASSEGSTDMEASPL